MWRIWFIIVFVITFLLDGCALKPPNPEHEAERAAIAACSETANNIGGDIGLWDVGFDMCMNQAGYSRKDRKILWP